MDYKPTINGSYSPDSGQNPPRSTKDAKYYTLLATKRSKEPLGEILRHSVQVPVDRKYARQTANFSPGSLIALRLVHFQVAYDSTYQFGPLLNVVLGSNGTGKSTIINAVFLLFRGILSSLDRHNYADCIQHGKPVAYVSALIRNSSIDAENLILTMRLFRADKCVPEMFVNGVPFRLSEYDVVMQHYNIQVNNLCQFLSQFRVVSFSDESAEQRLKSTESAVGYDGILEDHERLTTAGSESSQLRENIDRRISLISELTAARAELEERLRCVEDALNMRERVTLLEHVISIKKYEKAKEELNGLRQLVVDAQENLESVDEQLQPIRNEISQTERLMSDLERDYSSQPTENNAIQNFNEARKLVSDSQSAVRSLMARSKASKRVVERLASDVEILEDKWTESKMLSQQAQHELREDGIDDEAYRNLAADAERRKKDHETESQKLRQLEDTQQSYDSELASVQVNLASKSSQLQRLCKLRDDNQNDPRGSIDTNDPNVNYPSRRPEGLRKYWDNDYGLRRIVDFVNELQPKFQKPVVLPAILSVTITNDAIRRVFEMAVRSVQLRKFVCQSDRDQQQLSTLASRENLQLQTTMIVQTQSSHSYSESQMETLRKAGFDGVLTDFLSGPPAMMEFLKSIGLGTFLVSFRPLSDDALRLVRRLAERGGGLRCADSRFLYSFSQSRYGSRQITENTTTLPAHPKNWSAFLMHSEPFQSRSHNIQDTNSQIEELNQRIQGLEHKATDLQNKIADMAPLIQSSSDRMKDLSDLAKELIRDYKRQYSLRKAVDRCKQNESDVKDSIERKRRELTEEKNSLVTTVSQLSKAIRLLADRSKTPAKFLPTCLSAAHEREILSLKMQDCKNKIQRLQTASHEYRQTAVKNFDARRRDLANLISSQDEIRRAAKVATTWIRSNQKSHEAREIAHESDLEGLRKEMHRLNASISLYDQRSDSPTSIRAKLTTISEQLDHEELKRQEDEQRLSVLHQENDCIREKWEPEIRRIVQQLSTKFSQLFAGVGFQGHVELATPNELAVGTWGIDVFVSFREGELPTRLSRMRQSGGERAVTTAVYLLSLQHLGAAPFRVLDEINQGMDERNERTTMKMFVDLSCNLSDEQSNQQQYFLVTPKLIPNLPVHENMNVVIIYGSEAIENSEQIVKPTYVQDLRGAILKSSTRM